MPETDPSKKKFHELKQSISESIDRAKQNAEELHAIESALRENLAKLKKLRENHPVKNPIKTQPK